MAKSSSFGGGMKGKMPVSGGGKGAQKHKTALGRARGGTSTKSAGGSTYRTRLGRAGEG